MRSGSLLFLVSVIAFSALGFILFPANPQIMAVVVILGLGVLGSWLIQRTRDSSQDSIGIGLFLVAFTARLWVSYMLYGFGLSQVFGDEDATGWAGGWAYASRWTTLGIETIIPDIFNLFAGPLKHIGQLVVWGSVLYVIQEPSRLAVSAVNCFFGAMTVVVIYRLARKLFDEPAARIAAVFVLAWPSLVLLSASTSKEPLVIFLEWFLLYQALRTRDHPTVGRILTLLVCLFALYSMRSYAAYVCGIAILIYFLFSPSKHRVRGFALAIVLGLSGAFLLSQLGLLQKDIEFASVRLLDISDWRENVAATTGSGITVYDTSTELGTITSIPVAVAYFLFAPFPWDLGRGSLRNQLLMFEVLLFYGILFFGFWGGVKVAVRERWAELQPLLVFVILYASIQLLGLSNIGLAWRHRQTIMPLFLILSAVGFALRRQQVPSRSRHTTSVFLPRVHK